MRVDGHLIIANHLSPDMASNAGIDGVYASSNGQTHGSVFQCSKTDWIYLSAGVHIIDVVAQTNNAARVDDGLLRIKLTQFDQGTDINMPIITPPKIKSM